MLSIKLPNGRILILRPDIAIQRRGCEENGALPEGHAEIILNGDQLVSGEAYTVDACMDRIWGCLGTRYSKADLEEVFQMFAPVELPPPRYIRVTSLHPNSSGGAEVGEVYQYMGGRNGFAYCDADRYPYARVADGSYEFFDEPAPTTEGAIDVASL